MKNSKIITAGAFAFSFDPNVGSELGLSREMVFLALKVAPDSIIFVPDFVGVSGASSERDSFIPIWVPGSNYSSSKIVIHFQNIFFQLGVFINLIRFRFKYQETLYWHISLVNSWFLPLGALAASNVIWGPVGSRCEGSYVKKWLCFPYVLLKFSHFLSSLILLIRFGKKNLRVVINHPTIKNWFPKFFWKYILENPFIGSFSKNKNMQKTIRPEAFSGRCQPLRRVLCVTRKSPSKLPKLNIDICTILSAKGVVVDLIINEPVVIDFDHLSSKLLTVYGQLDLEKYNALLKKCDACIFFSQESAGMVAADAIDFCKPIIGYTGSGPHEIAAGFGCFYDYSVTDPQTLADAIVTDFKEFNLSEKVDLLSASRYRLSQSFREAIVRELLSDSY
jgi:glycosyltransferase involved in cell wall biosynthesis